MENLMTYALVIVFVFAAMVTVGGTLRWIGNSEERAKRLKFIWKCSVAFIGSMIAFFVWNFHHNELPSDADMVQTVQVVIKALGVGVLLVFFALLTLIFIVLAGSIVWTVFSAIGKDKEDDKETLRNKLQSRLDKIKSYINTPFFSILVTAGILALFVIMPLIIGDEQSSFTECWKDGIEQIAGLVKKGEKEEFSTSISIYALVFISIMGIGYVTANILYEIIKKRLEKRAVFMSEYSNAIGILAVGVSILCGILYKAELKNLKTSEVIQYAKPLVIVIFAIALGVLTLEIIRLLIDMRERLIRHEARYLFVLLVGICTMILVRVFYAVYNAVSAVLGGKSSQIRAAEEKMEMVYEEITDGISEDMIEELKDNTMEKKGPYKSFKRTITRK